MDILADRILVYGIGDEGYGCIYYREDFKQYEQTKGTEVGKKAIAKTDLITNFKEDGFVWKSGGYTMAETKKRAPAWLVSHKELQDGGDGFKEVGSKSKNCHILAEIDEDVWLIYS
jgi:hypothetical protein